MSKTKQLVKAAMMAAITAVLAQIVLPVGPIPFNLAVLGAYFAGMVLSPAWAAFSMLAYMFMGVIGIPVFAGFHGGAGVLFGNTGGYIFGYIALAVLTSLGRHGKTAVSILLMAAGLVVCYAFGTAWYMILTGSSLAASLTLCVVPFILPDVAKASCAYFLGKAVDRQAVKRIPD